MRLSGIMLALGIVLGLLPNQDFSAALRENAEDSVTISFVGDCTISTNLGGNSEGSLNWYAENYEPTYFFENVAEIFLNDDFTVANCETVLSDRDLTPRDKGEDGGFWFKGPTSNAKIFSSSGVEIVSVVNNHASDYGDEGYSDTIEALEAEGLTVLERNDPVYFEKNGITIGYIAGAVWYSGQESALLEKLQEMTEKSDIQIVYIHGGEEGLHEPESWRVQVFRRLADYGADLVIGCHAHVLQPMEEYNGATIVYGLGNFCFGGNRYPENRTIIYQYTFTKTEDGISGEGTVIPCYVYTGSQNNWQPALIPEDSASYQNVLDFMEWKRETP